jgi:hypothetical protein
MPAIATANESITLPCQKLTNYTINTNGNRDCKEISDMSHCPKFAFSHPHLHTRGIGDGQNAE